MLQIRPEQMEAMGLQARLVFEDRLYTTLCQGWPDVCNGMSEEAMHTRIRKGIEKAAAYGVTTELDVARYINLMFIWDEEFDISGKLPWATKILNDQTLTGSVKMRQLCHQTGHEIRKYESANIARGS